MTFSDALEYLKQGRSIHRDGWNGKGQRLYLVDGASVEVYVDGSADKVDHVEEWRPYIVIITAQGEHVPWIASQTDLLADDWAMLAVYENGRYS